MVIRHVQIELWPNIKYQPGMESGHVRRNIRETGVFPHGRAASYVTEWQIKEGHVVIARD